MCIKDSLNQDNGPGASMTLTITDRLLICLQQTEGHGGGK